MSAVEDDIQKLIVTTLRNTPAVMNLVSGIWDPAPGDPWKGKTAYIEIGPSTTQENDAECIPGSEVTFQIDIFSKGVGKIETRRIVDAVRKALHKRDDLQIPDASENAIVEMRVEFTRTVADPEPGITHGLLSLVILVEEDAETV